MNLKMTDNNMTSAVPENLVEENARRNEALKTVYDPIAGLGACGERVAVEVEGVGRVYVPAEMFDNEPRDIVHDRLLFNKTRFHYDFEFWCATCATVRDKVTGRNIKLVLNAPQRRVLAELERQRKSGQGLRMVLLKARQWGGSTLVLMYMAWIQIVLRKNWNSLICGHKRNTSSAIKGMYSKLLRYYPKEYLEEGKPLRFKTFEGSSQTQLIEPRDCLVIMGSSYSEDAVRGYDVAMAHLSEVAFWAQSAHHDPFDIIRSVDGTILLGDLSMIVLESTANGMGNFFHSQWLDACNGRSDKQPVFVPWHEIEIYRRPVADPVALWRSLDQYERDLWHEHGCTLEMINWYHTKRKAYPTHNLMMAEFPTTDIEAFANSGSCIFDLSSLDAMRRDCRPPIFVGDIISRQPHSLSNITLNGDLTRQLKIWAYPEKSQFKSRYIVAVDIGGRTEKADFSVITVLDRKEDPDLKPEVVAQWRGHIDHDRLAWKAAQLATYYDNALLVFESNSLDQNKDESKKAENILQFIKRHYSNLYRRENRNLGFHTNAKSKGRIVDLLIWWIRDHLYIERDRDAIDEYSWFELKSTGRHGAVIGKHDDIVMSRGIALLVASESPLTPKLNPADFIHPI
ncbi:MAG: hypothetical protein J5523_00715 [Muribaculaceae bacterium]|nr:hypothetical protein [Muribaculaceae bacterium]